MNASRLPNFVIAGVGGAGTTSLFSYLIQHPDICGSSVKEVQYFTPIKYGHSLADLASYAHYFSHCADEKYLVESTTGYFYGGEALISAMRERLPDPRILVILRDPTARLWSSFNYVKARLQIDRDCSFEEYFERSLDARIQGVETLDEFRPYSALSTGFYADHIGPWLEAFRSAFRVVFFEDLVHDARAVIEDICAWLEIDHAPAAHLEYRIHNRTVLPKRGRLQKIAIRANTRGEKFFRRHPALKTNLRQIYYRLNADKKPMRFEPIARRRVDAIYAASNEALAAELRLRGYHRLPAWLTAKRGLMAEGSHASSG